jgi:hypothetical protein
MTRDELLNAAQNMERYGGSFAESIALALYRADAYNTLRLVAAFPDLFERYYNFGTETV